jgi:hypothetical protein
VHTKVDEADRYQRLKRVFSVEGQEVKSSRLGILLSYFS